MHSLTVRLSRRISTNQAGWDSAPKQGHMCVGKISVGRHCHYQVLSFVSCILQKFSLANNYAVDYAIALYAVGRNW